MGKRGRKQHRTAQRASVATGSASSPLREISAEAALRRFDEMEQARTRSESTTTVFESYRRSTWVYGAISQIAGMVSQTPFVVLDSRGEPTSGKTPLDKAIARPNGYEQQDTSQEYRYAYMSHLLLGGSVMRILAGLEGFRPTEFHSLPRWRFRAMDREDENGMNAPFAWELLSRKGRTIRYTPGDDIYHDALFNPYHDYEGLAPLQAALVGIGNSLDVGEFAHRYFSNDGATGLIFTSDHPAFHQAQADEAAEAWARKHAGLSSAYKAKFLGYGLAPHTFGGTFDARSHQILNQLTKEEIVTGIFKIPLEVFGSQTRGTSGVTIGAPNPDTALETFLVNVIIPWARRYDQEFNRDMAWRWGENQTVAHDFSDNPLLERRRLERAKSLAELIDRGVPLNEAIRWLKLQITDQPHGNDWWVANNTIPAAVIMRAGDAALSLATGNARKESIESHAGAIMGMAQRTAVRTAVRRETSARSGDRRNGLSNAARIAEILGEGSC